MNIEKLKTYNQKLLAVLGTLIALMVAFGLIMLIFFGVTEITRELKYNNRQNDGILSDEKIEKLQKENKRQQLISYDFPRLVDTLNLVYMIPVSQKTLNSPENIDEEVLGLMDYSGSIKPADTRYSKRYYGSYNNLLIFDLKKNDLKKLFDDRINFNEINVEYSEKDILILFSASETDTYKDGVINLNDLKSLYIYSLKEQKLRKINLENSDIVNYDFINNRKDLIIQFGIDHNKDGKFDEHHESMTIKKYDYKNEKLVDIVDKEINELLQKTLEGTKE